MSKISPCLWFDGQAEEAAQLYTSLVPDSRIDSVNRAPDRRVHARPRILYRPQRRAPLQVHRGGFLHHPVRGPGRGRLLLGRADRERRRTEPVRLAQGQVRPVLADRPRAADRAVEAFRSWPRPARHGGDAPDEEDRYRRGGASRRWRLSPARSRRQQQGEQRTRQQRRRQKRDEEVDGRSLAGC
jgi:hypothetical protein